MTNQIVASRSSLIQPNRSDTASAPTTTTPPDNTSPPTHLLRSEKLLLAATGIGLLHHLDHILRYDHSGWPFRPEVNPFTFSLLVYPIILVILRARARPWLRVALTALIFLAVQTAHILIETPADQYGTWAYGVSSDSSALGHPNLLGVASPALGLLAATVSILASVVLLVTLAAFVADAMRHDARLSETGL